MTPEMSIVNISAAVRLQKELRTCYFLSVSEDRESQKMGQDIANKMRKKLKGWIMVDKHNRQVRLYFNGDRILSHDIKTEKIIDHDFDGLDKFLTNYIKKGN